MARKTDVAKEQVADKAAGKLKEQAQGLISEALDAAAARDDPAGSEQYAEQLLRQLEPLVAEYVSPPARILRILEDRGMKPATVIDLDKLPEQKPVKLTKDVYADKKGERLARKKRKGWKKVTY